MEESETLDGIGNNRGSNPRGVATSGATTYAGSVTRVSLACEVGAENPPPRPKRALPPEFLASIRQRGLGVKDLARLIGSHRPHVNRVLLGYPNIGGNTRKRLVRHLTQEEVSMLGWRADGSLDLSNAPLLNNVPHGTFRATWNFSGNGVAA